MKDEKKIYKYYDGSGNAYIIKYKEKIFIEYIPIKPTFSSSGFYNGGNYVKKEISKAKFNKIMSIINEGLSNKESHIKNRVKMSGMITIQEKNKEKTCILSPNSKILIIIEKQLQDLIKS